MFLGDRYELKTSMPRSGMIAVYLARDTLMDRDVAIKVLDNTHNPDQKFVTHFQQEAQTASVLQHPNIVQIYDYGQIDNRYYIVMELVQGTDLRRYLRSHGVLTLDRAVTIAHDIALGLGVAHHLAIVHQSVIPQHILVSLDNLIKLTAFGTTLMSTIQYCAPEQSQADPVTPATDIYALGIIIYEMLVGRTPFDGDTPVDVAMQHIHAIPPPPSQLNPAIPPPLEEIILCCLEKVPERRFQDGSQLARALEMVG